MNKSAICRFLGSKYFFLLNRIVNEWNGVCLFERERERKREKEHERERERCEKRVIKREEERECD